MRHSISLKTLLRTPARTALTFLLIAVGSFMLCSRIVDYVTTTREIEAITEYYQGVAAIDNGIPDSTRFFDRSRMPATFYHNEFEGWEAFMNRGPQGLGTEKIEALSNLPGVSSVETRYMTGGIIDDYERFYRWEDFNYGFDYTARFIIEGTYAGQTLEWSYRHPTHINWDNYSLYFENCLTLDGRYPLSQVRDIILEYTDKPDILVPDDFPEYGGDIFRLWQSNFVGPAGSWAVDAGPGNDKIFLANTPFNQDFIDGLIPGSRYVMIGIYYVQNPIQTFLGDNDTIEYQPSFVDITGQPDNYLELEEFSRLREIIDITKKDLHTFDIVYTSNMRAIPYVNEERMQLHEGRFLTPEDDEVNANVCVVSHAFYTKNNLSIGDTLTIELGDRLFMQHAGMGAITYTPERAYNIAETVEFEIVGVYIDTTPPNVRRSEQYWGYHPCTVFVPKSFLPIEVPADHEVYAGEFSIVVENPADIEVFRVAANELVSGWVTEQSWDYEYLNPWDPASGEVFRWADSNELENTLRFSDLGWMRVKDNVNTGRTSALATTIFYVLTSIVAIALAVYLYIARNKKPYAIMRALGTTVKKAENTVTFPIFILSSAAVATGAVAGYIYTSQNVSTALDNIPNEFRGIALRSETTVAIMILCLVATLGFIMLLTRLFLRRISRKPVLEILQGDVIKVKETKANSAVLQEALSVSGGTEIVPFKLNISELNLKDTGSKRYTAFSHIARYIMRHIARVPWKSLCCVVLAVMLIGAVGFLALTRELYTDLFYDTRVNMKATSYSASAVNEINNSELTDNLYYYSKYVTYFNYNADEAFYLNFTNDFEQSIQNISTDEYEVVFTDGFDNASIFEQEDLLSKGATYCVIGSYFGVMPGDTVLLIGPDKRQRLTFEYQDGGFEEALAEEASTYTVAAVVYSEREDLSKEIWVPMSGHVIDINNGEELTLEHSAFMLTDNDKTVELLTLLEDLRGESLHISAAAEYSADMTELDNVRRVLDLLTIMFPIALGASVLIGFTVPLLIIMQSAKEAVILRVLGTSKRRVRCIFTFEQVLLCIAGIIFASSGLVIYNSWLFVRSAQTLAICVSLYLLVCICAALTASISVTKRRILVLLQVKE